MERKCGVCREPGHTRKTCPQAEQAPVLVLSEGAVLPAPTEIETLAELHPADEGAVSEEDPENWNNTGHPKPTMATVGQAVQGFADAMRETGEKLAEQRPRLLDTIRTAKEAMERAQATTREGLALVPPQPADPWSTPTQAGVTVTSATVTVGGDPWSVPTPTTPEVPQREHTNRTGYLVKDPETGDFRRFKNGNKRGFTRVTTFNKAASDSTAITAWGKRNVVVGASRRPDLVAQAHGKHVAVDKGFLDSLVEELEKAADAKVSADVGTLVHDYTERIDAGEITMDDVPPAYRGHVGSYLQALKQAGLEVVPSLIEGTVFIREFGGLTGKFDRILRHIASGDHFMGDLKTGKNMVYGWDEIEAQEALYTDGYNRDGTYHWSDDPEGVDDRWVAPEYHVRRDEGVVMWLPVQEPTKPYPAGFSDANPPRAGVCYLLKTDLQRGWRYAELCHEVRESRSNKGKPQPWTEPQTQWSARLEVSLARLEAFTAADEARRLYLAAEEAGADANFLEAIAARSRELIAQGLLT